MSWSLLPSWSWDSGTRGQSEPLSATAPWPLAAVHTWGPMAQAAPRKDSNTDGTQFFLHLGVRPHPPTCHTRLAGDITPSSLSPPPPVITSDALALKVSPCRPAHTESRSRAGGGGAGEGGLRRSQSGGQQDRRRPH